MLLQNVKNITINQLSQVLKNRESVKQNSLIIKRIYRVTQGFYNYSVTPRSDMKPAYTQHWDIMHSEYTAVRYNAQRIHSNEI